MDEDGIRSITAIEADLPPNVPCAHHEDEPFILFVRRGLPPSDIEQCITGYATYLMRNTPKNTHRSYVVIHAAGE